MNTFEYRSRNCSYFFSPSLRRFGRGAAMAAAVAVSVFGTTRPADAQDCQPDATGTACTPVTCPVPGQVCQSTCVDFDPVTGAISVTECNCTSVDECHVENAQGAGPALRSSASDPCVISDPGTGTIELPPIGCEYLSPEEVHEIIDANSGATFELAPIHKDFVCNRGDGFPGCPPPGFCEGPGGTYGGNVDCFESSLDLDVSIPSIPTFARTLNVPVLVQVETAPRTPGDAVQDFETRMNFVQGELFGDPDFCLFRVTGGDGFGLPSPGHTTLTRLGPPGSDFQVDSFFDITYRIEFQGCPGSQLEGMDGDTTGTIRMETGGVPDCLGGCPPGEVCERTDTVDPASGHIEICCQCVPDTIPDPDPHTTVDPTIVTFGTADVPPIPADFFDPGSDPFIGIVSFVGSGMLPDNADTLIQRSSDIGPLAMGGSATVDVELVALSLVSADPIPVTNGTSTSQWDVDVDLSPGIGSSGQDGLTATKTNANGGTYDAHIPVLPRFTFTRVDDPTEQRVLDYRNLGLDPIQINIFAAPWVVSLNASLHGNVIAPNDGDFVPGIEHEDIGAQVVVDTTGVSKGGGVDHTVRPVTFCDLLEDPAIDPCGQFQTRDCEGSPVDLCLPKVVQVQPVPPGGLATFECACHVPGSLDCGPIQFVPGSDTVVCPGDCAAPDIPPCQIWVDDGSGLPPTPTGQQSASAGQFPPGSLLFCDCAPPCQSDADCDDNDPCTNDVCLADGTCQNTPECASNADCDDGDICTIDVCDPATGCCISRPNCASDADCADFDPCTIDTCRADGCCENLQDPTCNPPEACCLFDGRCIDVSPETCCDIGGVPQGAGTDCTTVDCPVAPIWTGMNIDIHQDNTGVVANDFHIEGIVESSRPPVVIDHIDDLFPNYTDTIWQGDPECPTGSIWWCFEADWSGADYPYCTTLHLGLLFEVVCHNVMIDLVGWWTIDGVPVGGALPQAGFWPILGFDVEDNIRVEPAPEPPDPNGQNIRLRNGNANGMPEAGEIPVEIIQMDLVAIGSSGLDGLLGPRPLEELRVGGLQETLPWVPVVDEAGLPISPVNPVPMLAGDEIMVLLRPAPGAANGRMRMLSTAQDMDIPPGGYLIARQLMRFEGNGPARAEEIRWAWELHGAHNIPLPEACCFENGTCAHLTPSECVCQGGTPQGLGTVCDADGDGVDDACATGACCLHDGTCIVAAAADCAIQGGVYAGDGTDCTDADLNGIADECEPDVCEPTPDGSACQGPCPTGGCFGECINGAYCDNPACCLIPGQCLCYAPNTKESIKYCGDCFGECIMGAYCDDINRPECWIMPGAPACYAESTDISIQLCPDNTCFGECVNGGYCDVDPDCCIMGPGSCACYDPDHWISIKLCGENQPTPPQECHATCVTVDPVTGDRVITVCECKGQDECHVDLPGTAVVPGARETGGDPCVVTNASGTVELPPIGCEYLSADEVHEIIDANSGVTFELAPIHKDFICNRSDGFPGCPPPNVCEDTGGDLGGNVDCFESNLEMQVSSPALPSFSRTLFVPILCQAHTGPRTPGDAVQEFDTKMNFLQGELFGDPDFCMLRVTGGDGFGLPSPGHTTLTRLGPPGSDFAVDSFFDITYRIEFEGCPGSQLEGMSGDTTATIRMVTGSTPDCVGACPPNTECVEQRTVNADGSIELCCECVDACVIATPVDVDFAPLPPDIGFGAKNRYMTFRSGDAGRLQAVQVEFTNLPDYPYANGRTAWVQAPFLVTEASGSNAGAPPPTMWAARLGCTPFYADWSVYDRVDVFDDGIVQRSRYDVRIIDATCDCMIPAHYSPPTTVHTSAIGDVVGNTGCAVLPCDAPQGVIDFVDISGVVDKFRNLPRAPRKARADLINSVVTNPIPDQKIDFVDISYCVDGFRGAASLPPGPPTADPCPGPCP